VEGNVNMDSRSVLSRLLVKPNTDYHPTQLAEKVQSSVSALYESGYFDDVSAWADYTEVPGELDLVFKVSELPALDTFDIEGNDEVSIEDLRPKVALVMGQVYSKSQLERDRQSLLAHYRSEGFLLAEVGVREEPADESRNKVIFIVREGKKVKVEGIDVTGNPRVPADDIRDHMATKQDHWWGEGEFKETVFEGDRDSVLNLARHFGFLDAALVDYRAEYLPDSTCQFYLGRLAAKGRDLELVYGQLNRAISDSGSPLHALSGRSMEMSSHYYRQHRKSFAGPQAVPVPVVKDEQVAADILNRVITYSNLRKEWNAGLLGKKWSHPRVDSLLKLKKRTGYEDRLLARLTLEETFSGLMPYDSVNTSSYVRVHIGLNEGRRYYAGAVRFTGNEVLPEALLKSQVRLDSGKAFDYYEYEATRKAVTDVYREDGYLFVQLDERKEFENDSIVHLNFSLREGLPAQVHKVKISGNTKTKDKVIRREIKLFPGDTYRQSLMERSFRDIMQLNYFDGVVPDIQVVGEQDVDLVFNVTEREAGTGQFSAGLAYSQSDGLVGTLGLSIPNCCMGDGQSANLNVEYGTEKQNYSIGFSEPWLWDTPTKLGFSLNYTWYEGDDDPDITRYGGSVYLGRRLKWPDDYFYGQIGYSWQMNEQGDNIANSMVRNSGVESSVTFTLIRDDKNLPMFPTDGSRYVLTSQVATDLLGSEFEFVKNDLSVKWWFPLYSDLLALGITNEFGVITGDAIQYRTLYQMGGVLGYQGMMRGYSAGTIGYRRLGRSYQYFGAELTWPIAPNRFYLLPLFFDAGNVFGSRYSTSTAVSKNQGSPLRDWDPANLKRDFGFGFRVIVPMLGIIGFDFAWPLDPGETYAGFDTEGVGAMEFNFIIGQGF
jgi:outer membrane protein insertion porin family